LITTHFVNAVFRAEDPGHVPIATEDAAAVLMAIDCSAHKPRARLE
jgi:hypothetical protein